MCLYILMFFMVVHVDDRRVLVLNLKENTNLLKELRKFLRVRNKKN